MTLKHQLLFDRIEEWKGENKNITFHAYGHSLKASEHISPEEMRFDSIKGAAHYGTGWLHYLFGS